MKKYLIIFPDEWLAYAPTVLNMAKLLSEQGSVTVVTFWDIVMSNGAMPFNGEIIFLKISKLIKDNLSKWGYFNLLKIIKLAYLLFFKLETLGKKYDIIFGVDALGYICGRLFSRKVVFLSLEVERNFWQSLANFLGIRDLAIQSYERRIFLLGEAKDVRCHILPNAPIIKQLPSLKVISQRQKNKLLYFGNIAGFYALDACIASLEYLNSTYSLTLKGFISEEYKSYITEKYVSFFRKKRLFLDTEYIDEDKFMNYVQLFTVGLCFYDLSLPAMNNYNVLSSPSGKMHNYFASAVPVVGSDIPGLQCIQHFHAGILVKTVNGQAIASAINRLLSQYDGYVQGALKAAEHYDFEKHFSNLMYNI